MRAYVQSFPSKTCKSLHSSCAHVLTLFCQHCRKCGLNFCHACSSRSTILIDTTNLPFITPPRGIPISNYHSASSPVTVARVCDRCHIRIHTSSNLPPAPRTKRKRITPALVALDRTLWKVREHAVKSSIHSRMWLYREIRIANAAIIQDAQSRSTCSGGDMCVKIWSYGANQSSRMIFTS